MSTITEAPAPPNGASFAPGGWPPPGLRNRLGGLPVHDPGQVDQGSPPREATDDIAEGLAGPLRGEEGLVGVLGEGDRPGPHGSPCVRSM